MSEVLNLTKEEARALVYGDSDKDIEVVQDNLVDTTRWSEVHEIVVKSDGKFYRDQYSVGATEMQDESPWEYSEPNFIEVFPVEKTVTIYEARN